MKLVGILLLYQCCIALCHVKHAYNSNLATPIIRRNYHQPDKQHKHLSSLQSLSAGASTANSLGQHHFINHLKASVQSPAQQKNSFHENILKQAEFQAVKSSSANSFDYKAVSNDRLPSSSINNKEGASEASAVDVNNAIKDGVKRQKSLKSENLDEETDDDDDQDAVDNNEKLKKENLKFFLPARPVEFSGLFDFSSIIRGEKVINEEVKKTYGPGYGNHEDDDIQDVDSTDESEDDNDSDSEDGDLQKFYFEDFNYDNGYDFKSEKEENKRYNHKNKYNGNKKHNRYSKNYYNHHNRYEHKNQKYNRKKENNGQKYSDYDY
ncbi:hypothetical protein HDU92_005989 [Lobulomyces angularis]|nr:hypothetical protein HDU92_005989 [Lobulomyces angularis]